MGACVARSTRDFARGRCDAEDVERAVARRMLFLQALRYWRPAVAPGGAKANSTRIRAPPTISEETASRLHLVERGKKNVRGSRASCVEWSDARESVFMVRGRRPRRVLKLRSRKTDAVRKISTHHLPLLFTSQTHVCSDTGAAHDQRRHTLAISSCRWLIFSAHGGVRNQIDAGVGREYEQIRAPPMTIVLGMQHAGEDARRHLPE